MRARHLGLGLGILAGGIAFLALFWQLQHPPHPPAVPPMPPVELPAAAPLEPFRLPPQDHYGIVTSRPLFITERRPEPPPPPEEEAPPQPPPLPTPEQKFVVFGVLLTPGTQAALLRLEEPHAKTTRVRVGEQIGEWRLERISPQGVVLRKGEVVRELPLTRRRRPGGPPPVRTSTAQPQVMPGAPLPTTFNAEPGQGMPPDQPPQSGMPVAQPAPVANP